MKRVLEVYVFVLAVGVASAAGPAMPWDNGMTVFLSNITGPMAGAVAMIAIVFGGASLLMGGEWEMFRTRPDKAAHQSQNILGHSFAKPFFAVLLVLGILLGAAQIIALFGFGAGAVLPAGGNYLG